jgi:hypothetical protein
MKPDERANALADIINGHLKEAGVPELKVKTESGTGANGHLDFQKWEILVNEGKLNTPTMDEGQLGELANTIYHEARHGEQWYMMARHMAETGMTPAEISAKTRIPEAVCDAAAAEPKMSPQQSAEAQKYYDSVYGKDSTHRNQVLNDLKDNPGRVQNAKAEYEAAVNDPRTTPAERQAKLKAWQDAYAKYQADYQKYRALPEEADAWATGDAAEQAFKNAPKPDTAVDPTKTEPTTGKTEPTTGKTEPTTGKTEPTTGKTDPDTSNPSAHPEPGKTGDLEPGNGPLSSTERANLPHEQQVVYDKAWEFYRSQGFADERIEGHDPAADPAVRRPAGQLLRASGHRAGQARHQPARRPARPRRRDRRRSRRQGHQALRDHRGHRRPQVPGRADRGQLVDARGRHVVQGRPGDPVPRRGRRHPVLQHRQAQDRALYRADGPRADHEPRAHRPRGQGPGGPGDDDGRAVAAPRAQAAGGGGWRWQSRICRRSERAAGCRSAASA